MAIVKHDRRRRDIALLVLVYAAYFAYLGTPFEYRGSEWQALCLCALALALSVGLWFAREWARLAGATVGLFIAVSHLIQLIAGIVEDSGREMIFDPIGLVVGPTLILSLSALWALIGIYLLRRSAREAFVQAHGRARPIR